MLDLAEQLGFYWVVVHRPGLTRLPHVFATQEAAVDYISKLMSHNQISGILVRDAFYYEGSTLILYAAHINARGIDKLPSSSPEDIGLSSC